MSNEIANTNNTQTFHFLGFEIRALLIEGKPWFVKNDIVDALGIPRKSTLLRSLPDRGVFSKHPSAPEYHGQKMTLINEGNLYRIIMRSDSPYAMRFQDWVADEVLPQIRETGSYNTPTKELTGAELVAKALIEANSMLEAKDREIAELKPDATSYKHWNNELEGEMSRRDLCNKLREHYNINETVLREHMHEKGDLAKRNGFDKEGRRITWYVPTTKAIDKGWAKQYPSGKFTKYKWTPSYYAELVKRFTPRHERLSIMADQLF